MKRKPLITLSVFLLITLGSLVWYAENIYPAKCAKDIMQRLYAFPGMDGQPPAYSQKGNTLLFNNLILDADGFNTIENVRVDLIPAYYFWNAGIQKISIMGPAFTAEFNEAAPLQSFTDTFSHQYPDIFFAAKTIEILGGKADLITRNFGGVRIGFDGQIRTTEDGSKSAQINLHAAQKQLSGDIRINAQIKKSGAWHSEIVIDQARLDLDGVQLTRISGNITGDGFSKRHYLKGEYNIGALNYFGVVLDDVALTYEQHQNGLSWVMGGNAQRAQELEIGVNYSSMRPDHIFGTIYAQDIPSFIDFFGKNLQKETRSLQPLQDLFLTFNFPIGQILKPDKVIQLGFENIEIGKALQSLQIKKSKAEGFLSGSILFSFRDKVFKPLRASIKNEGRGKIMLPQSILSKALPQKSIGAREALKDYAYDYFHITLKGDLPKETEIGITIGKSKSENIVLNWTSSIEPLLNALSVN